MCTKILILLELSKNHNYTNLYPDIKKSIDKKNIDKLNKLQTQIDELDKYFIEPILKKS